MRFAELLPVSMPEFLSEYWEQKFLHAQAREDSPAFSLSEIMQAYASGRGSIIGYMVGDEHQEFRERRGTIFAQEIDGLKLGASGLEKELARGTTLQLRDAEAALPAIGVFANNILRATGIVARTQCMIWAGRKSSGMDLHYDEFDVFHIHLHGAKRWTLSNSPFKKYPIEQATAIADGHVEIKSPGWETEELVIKEDELAKIDMEPGSVLYVPAGTWHRTEVLNDEVAVSVAVALLPVTFRHVLEELIAEEVGVEELWRHPVPSFFAPDLHDPQNFVSFGEARVKEVMALLQNVSLDDSRWRSAAAAVMTRRESLAAQESTDDLDYRVSPTTKLAPTTFSPFLIIPFEDSVVMVVLGNEFNFDLTHADFAYKLAAQSDPFVASEAQTWSPTAEWEEVQEWLTTLCEHGALNIL